VRNIRNIKRSQSVHGKELNKIFFSYIFEADGKSKSEKKKVFDKWNKEWAKYCFKHRKHKVIPPSPDGLKMMSKDLTMVNQVQGFLGIEKTKTFWSKLKRFFVR